MTQPWHQAWLVINNHMTVPGDVVKGTWKLEGVKALTRITKLVFVLFLTTLQPNHHSFLSKIALFSTASMAIFVAAVPTGPLPSGVNFILNSCDTGSIQCCTSLLSLFTARNLVNWLITSQGDQVFEYVLSIVYGILVAHPVPLYFSYILIVVHLWIYSFSHFICSYKKILPRADEKPFALIETLFLYRWSDHRDRVCKSFSLTSIQSLSPNYRKVQFKVKVQFEVCLCNTIDLFLPAIREWFNPLTTLHSSA